MAGTARTVPARDPAPSIQGREALRAPRILKATAAGILGDTGPDTAW